jgi:hypothetical protein
MEIKASSWTFSALKDQFVSGGIQWNAYAEKMLSDPSYPRTVKKDGIKVVAFALSSLGLPQGGNREEVERAIEGTHLLPVPLAYVPAVALLWPRTAPVPACPKGQHPVGAQLLFTPLLHDGSPTGFYLVTRADGQWLRGYVASPDYVFPPDAVFLFCSTQNKDFL